MIILTKWLEILVEKIERYQTATLRIWTPKLVRKLNFVSNKTSHIVYFWLDNILGGYITEFAVDCTQSYSVTEMDLFKGTCGRFMKSLGTGIKVLLCDKCVMKMDSDC
jgi:hypothetical protein